MRSPSRIPKIMRELQAMWLAYPDLRLGQLILNCMVGKDLYFIEDTELIELLKKGYKDAAQRSQRKDT